MYVLAIETTGPLCSVALLKENKVIAERFSELQKNHLKDLMPMISEIMQETAIDTADLGCIGVSIGPGSFTGIRIGVASARAMAQVLDIPVAAVHTLDSFCAKRAAASSDRVTCGIINARRGQVYGIVEGYMQGCACMLTDVLSVLEEKVLGCGLKAEFYGDGIDAYGDEIFTSLKEAGYEYGRDWFFASEEDRYQKADSVGYIACKMALEDRLCGWKDLLPDYMRKAEAEQKLEEGRLHIPHASL